MWWTVSLSMVCASSPSPTGLAPHASRQIASMLAGAAASAGASVAGGWSAAVGGRAVDEAVVGINVVACDVNDEVLASLAHAARNLLAGRITSPSPAARRNRRRSTYLPGTATADSGAFGADGSGT